MYKSINKSLLFVYLTIAIIIGTLGFSSCSKVSDQSVKDDQGNDVKFVNVDGKNLSESDKDLKEVDYREVYDQLSSKGKWIEVSGKDLGIKMSDVSAYNESGFQKSLYQFITGVSDANADEDIGIGMVYVWQPADNLTVAVSAGEPVAPPVAYVPYTNGQWVNSDAGWYFQAPTPEEEVVHHYGRWAQTQDAGWLWVPGSVWAPAWVDWRQNDNYVAWAPVPPSVYVINDEFYPPQIPQERYFCVEQRHFCDPQVYQYNYSVIQNNLQVNTWNRPTGIFVENHSIINRGPNVSVIEQSSGRTFDMVKINHVNNMSEINHSDKQINSYTPGFKRMGSDQKVNTNKSDMQPKSFVKYDDAKKNNSNSNRQPNVTNNNKNSSPNGVTQNKAIQQDKTSRQTRNNVSKNSSSRNNGNYTTKNNVSNNTRKSNSTGRNTTKNNSNNNVSKQNSHSNNSGNNKGVTKNNTRNSPSPQGKTQGKNNNKNSPPPPQTKKSGSNNNDKKKK